MSEDYQIAVHIDLRGMTGRMQRLLRRAMNIAPRRDHPPSI
jgi:hypothetical protein